MKLLTEYTTSKDFNNKNAFNESIREDYPIPKKLYDIKDNKAYWPEDAEDFI